jgi:hypothetical protein
MANQKNVTLYQGAGSSKDITLRDLPVADVVTTPIYLYQGEASAKDIRLRDPSALVGAGAETGSSAAPLIAVAAIVANGRKGAQQAAPLSAAATITALGREGESENAPLIAVAAIAAAGRKGAQSEAPISATATITSEGVGAETAVASATQTGAHGRKRGRELQEFLDSLPVAAREAEIASPAPAVANKVVRIKAPAPQQAVAPTPAYDEEEEILLLLLAA